MVSTYIPEALIADDEPVCREILRLYLESFGCRVHVACGGHQALAAYQDRADGIGLVILDACMPGPSPIELYSRIRQISPHVPILFCSGVSPGDPIMAAINQSGLELLTKPFNRSDLRQAILRVVKAAEARTSALNP